MNDLFGIRGLGAFLSGAILIILYVIAVLTGRNPLELPLGPDGNPVTPELIINMLVPAVTLIYTFVFFLRGVNTRVDIQDADPEKATDLFKLREFWLLVVSTLMAGLNMFNLKLWQEGQQAAVADVIVNLIMMFVAGLQGSYSARPHGVLFTDEIESEQLIRG